MNQPPQHGYGPPPQPQYGPPQGYGPPGYPQPGYGQPPPKQGMSTGLKIVLAIVGVGAIGTLGTCAMCAAVMHKAAGNSAPSLTAADGKAFDFLTGIAGFDQRYDQAPNEIKKSAVFNEARAWEQTFFKDSPNITDWKGTIASLTTNKGGERLSLTVRLGSKFERPDVEFMQGGLFGGIDKNSPLYKQASEFVEGSCVLFSGKVEPKASNITEALSMSSPEYKIDFSALKACSK